MKKTGKLALGGILTGLALVCLSLTVMPVTTVGLAGLAGICGIPLTVALGRQAGCVHFTAVSLLAALLIPSVEGKLMYFCFFGHYTVVKAWLEHFPLPRWAEYLLKTGVFLLSLGGYGGAWYILTSPALPDWFRWWLLPLGGLALTAVFWVYDRCLTGLVGIYITRLHPTVSRLFHLK